MKITALILPLFVVVIACQPPLVEGDDGGTGTNMDPPTNPVTASFRLVDAATGRGFEGGVLALGQMTARTDPQGSATLEVPPGAFDVRLTGPGLAAYTLSGAAGTTDFSFISYVSTRTTTAQVAAFLGTRIDPTRGILVVAADDPQLKPAVGTKVAIDAEADAPFIIAGAGPKRGDTVVAGGSFVSFFNVVPGSVRINLTPPTGRTCHVAPGPGPRDTVEVAADGVTVIAYVCE